MEKIYKQVHSHEKHAQAHKKNKLIHSYFIHRKAFQTFLSKEVFT